MSRAGPSQWRPPRRAARIAAVALAVSLMHGLLGWGLQRAGAWAGRGEGAPAAIAVSFVELLRPAAPPRPAPVQPATARLAQALPGPAPAASAPLPEQPAGMPPAGPPPTLPEPPPLAPPAAAPALAAADAAASAAAADHGFEWPPSTRLDYVVSGDYRGPVHGQARVEWRRDGARYQVAMDLSVGPSFAPLASRRVASEGRITPQGLYPLRYDETTQLAFSAARHSVVLLGTQQVQLASGLALPRPEGLQDSASQFVQLTWLFTNQPQLLEPGRAIELPLALPRRLEPWIYDVRPGEWLDTPVGALWTLPVKPRREPRPGGDMTAEIWVAPSLQYLPVRILIRQDAQTHVDLLLRSLPLQATTAGSSAPPR